MKRFIVSMLVIAAAVTSAFTVKATPDSSIETGFIRHNLEGTDCEESDDCETINTTVLCRVGQSPAGAQLWVMNANGQCLRVGYKPI